MKRALAIVIATLALAGCSMQSAKVNTESGQATPASTATAAAQPAESSSAQGPRVASVGGPGYTYEDGMQINVISVKPFKIGQYAAGGTTNDLGLKVRVMVFNGSEAPVDLVTCMLNLKAGPDGIQAEMVFDEGIKTFEGKVAPGQRATADYGFALPKGTKGRVTIEASPAFNYDSSLFQTTI